MSATISRSRVAPEEISQAVFEQLVPELITRYPSVSVKEAGELEEIGEIRSGMKRALLLAAVLIYVLMAVPLKSYWQPIVILAIVPFGFVGAGAWSPDHGSAAFGLVVFRHARFDRGGDQ